MYKYEKKLPYPLNIKKQDLKMAKLLLSQFGGANSELGASLRYFSQKFTMPDEHGKNLLNDIATEELGHIEMIASMINMLSKDATIEEIKEANELGVICGVTTNPSLIAKEGRDFIEVVKEISTIVDGPISAEVISLDHKGMVEEADKLAKIHKNIVIKLPMTLEGLKATKILSQKGIKTNVTLIFSATQALLAARAGATYVSPFVGRLDDIGQDGLSLIEEIVDIFNVNSIETQIIVASVRNPIHVSQAARLGADIATVPYKVITQMSKHPLTDKGIENFLKDWEGASLKL